MADRGLTLRKRAALLALPALVAGGLLAVVAGTQPAGAVEIVPAPASGVWTVDGHGNGHGHGLSQYGARGAAIAGLSYDRILAFYYPGTTLAIGSAVPIRVGVSGVSAYPAFAAEPGLLVTGVTGALPTAGVDQYRGVPIAGGFQLQHHGAGGWQPWKNIAAGKLDVRDSDGTVTLERSGTPSTYRGIMSLVKTGASAIAVNSVSLDDYVRGVVPSEMPASWQSAAVQAQAVAARSYGRYFVTHPRDPNFDICDTTSCQVYGGVSAEQAASNTAVSATANRVLTYGGATIFAEFSASNGGITSAGNQPYFVTKLDPYDNAGTGDPYLNWTTTVRVADVAAAYGLSRVSQLQITGRAPGGQWGGLVTSANVVGTGTNGAATSVAATGPGLASAMGLSYSFFHVRPVLPVGHLDSARLTALHTVTVAGWAMDLGNGGASVSVQVSVNGVPHTSVANLARPDVQAHYHSGSAAHGFLVALPVPGGTSRVCVTALSLAGSDRTSLGCLTVSVPVNPVGHVDSLSSDGHGHYRLVGWTFDPDRDGGPSRVHVYVDAGGYSLPAALVRPDVQGIWRTANAAVGFDVTVGVPAGRHQLCAYGINEVGTAGVNQTLRCFVVIR